MNQYIQIPYYYLGSRNLRFKLPLQQGNDITVLQTLLNLLPENIVGTRLKVDGIFGSFSRYAVKSFQQHFGLRPDGIVGQETFYRLGHLTGKYSYKKPVFSSRILKQNSQGYDVFILQNRLAAFKKTYLNRPGHSMFNLETSEAMRRFQDDFPVLNADGIVGPETFDLLFIHAPLGGRVLRQGRNGLDTYLLQFYLYELGYYYRKMHGYFDIHTQKALAAFQNDARIRVDGIAGPQTFLALGTSIGLPRVKYFYRVKKGDTVFKIAGLFSKNIEDIIKLNNIKPPDYAIYTGQMLEIPVPLTFHLAEKGDTLSKLAKKYALPETDLAKANYLFPPGGLLPDEMVVLPRHRQNLEGNIIFLNQSNENFELKSINLINHKTLTLKPIENLSTKRLFLSNDKKKILFFTDNGTCLNSFDITACVVRTISLPASVKYMDWSYDGQKIVINNAAVINFFDGKEIFTFNGTQPHWLQNDKTLLYFINNSTLKKINIETGIAQEILTLAEEFIWASHLSRDNRKLLIFAYVPPGRVTITIMYDLLTKELFEISSSDFAAQWSANSEQFLLMARDYYGEFFPWFYYNLKLYSASGDFIGQELYAKNMEITADNFSSDDSHFLAIMNNTSNFYPLPAGSRDIVIKKKNTRLITRVTSNVRAYSPVWLSSP